MPLIPLCIFFRGMEWERLAIFSLDGTSIRETFNVSSVSIVWGEMYPVRREGQVHSQQNEDEYSA